MISLLILTIVLGASASVIQLPKNQTACAGADWSDIVIFLVANYVAHTATVIRFAGETTRELNWRRSDALLAPFIGLMFALRKIQWSLVFECDPLRRACRGEALCQIVRTSLWQPWDGCTIRAWVLEKALPSAQVKYPANSTPSMSDAPDSLPNYTSEKFVRKCRLAFSATEQTGAKPVPVTTEKLELVQGLGVQSIPSGYGVLRCQGIPALKITGIDTDCKPYYDHRIMESIIAMFQIMSATVSVYRSRGEQFERYGYTAFSLTVLPYAVMSFANLLANLLSMDYPLLYLVSTPEMKEAVTRGASVTTVVGELTPDYAVEEKLVPVRFEAANGVLYAYTTSGGVDSFLGELDLADPTEGEALELCSLVTVPSYIKVEEEKSRLSIGNFLREHLGLMLAIPVGIALFSTPSITIRLLTQYKPGQSMILERAVSLLWLFLQQFSLLFLLAWNFAFRVEHALRAPQPYSRILELVLGCMLRAVGIAGYICAIWQFKRFGVCIQV